MHTLVSYHFICVFVRINKVSTVRVVCLNCFFVGVLLGSKNEIYTSRVHYMIHKGTPYLIVPENDMHNIVKLLILHLLMVFGK